MTTNYHNTLQAVTYLKQKFSKFSKQQKQPQKSHVITPQIQATMSVIKFRRVVISILVCNRLKKKQFMRTTETDFKTIQKLAEGLSNCKQMFNRSISAHNVDEILTNANVRQSLIKIFNSKDFYNHHLFELETTLDEMSRQIGNLSSSLDMLDTKFSSKESDYKELNERFLEMEAKFSKTLEHIQHKY